MPHIWSAEYFTYRHRRPLARQQVPRRPARQHPFENTRRRFNFLFAQTSNPSTGVHKRSPKADRRTVANTSTARMYRNFVKTMMIAAKKVQYWSLLN